MNPRLELVEAERKSDNRLSSDFTTSQVCSDGAVVYSDSTACQSADEMSSNHSISLGSIRYDPKCQPWPQNTKLSLTKIDRVAEYGLLHPDFLELSWVPLVSLPAQKTYWTSNPKLDDSSVSLTSEEMFTSGKVIREIMWC